MEPPRIGWAKVAISVGLLFWLAWIADGDAILDQFQQVKGWYVAFGILSLWVCFAVAFWRWCLLLAATAQPVRRRDLFGLYWVGLFFNQMLPTGFGGDAVRAIALTRRGYGLAGVLASTMVDRVVGLIGVVVLCLAGVAIFSASSPSLAGAVLPWLIGLLFATVTGYLLYPRLEVLLLSRFERALPPAWRFGFGELREAFRRLYGRRALLINAVLLSVVSQFFIIVTYQLVATGMAVEVTFGTYGLMIPLVLLAQALPISISGLGVREAALVGVAILMGWDKQTAISLSLLFLATTWLAVLPGLAFAFYYGVSPRREQGSNV